MSFENQPQCLDIFRAILLVSIDEFTLLPVNEMTLFGAKFTEGKKQL